MSGKRNIINADPPKNFQQTDPQETMEWTWTTSALAQLSHTLLTANTIQDVLQASLAIIGPTDVNGVTMLLSGEPSDAPYMEIAANWEQSGQPAFPLGSRLDTREYQLHSLLTSGRSLVVQDLASDEQIGEPLRSTLLQANVQSLVALPLGLEQDPFGVILIDRTPASPFSPEAIHIYETVAALAAGAIEKLRLIQQTRQALNETSALYTISRRLSESQSTNDILLTVLDSELFGAVAGSIALLEPASDSAPPSELIFWAAAGTGADKILGMRLPVSKGIIGWVVRENKPALVPDAYADERFYHQIDRETTFHTQSILCAPLRSEGQVIGAIELVDVHQERLNEQTLRLLGQVADQATLFIENQRLLDKTQRQAQEFSMLLDVSQELASTLDRKETLNVISSRVLDMVEADGCHVFLLQSHPNLEATLIPVASSDRDAKYILKTPLKLGQGITGRVAQSGSGVLVNRVDLDPRGFQVPGTERVPESLISVPLTCEGRLIGVMSVSRRGEKEFIQDDLNIVSAMASQAATVLENARLFDEAQQRSQELAALNAVVSTASQSLTLNEILNTTLERIAQVMPSSAGLVCLHDATSGEPRMATQLNLPESLAQRLRQKGMGGTLCEVTTNRGQTYSVPDLTQDAPVDTADLTKVGLRSYLGTPLIARGNTLGALCVFGAQANTFTPADADLLTAIGQQVSISVRNAQLYEQTERALEESQALFEASESISNALELSSVLQITINQMAEYVGADQCRAVLFDEALGYGQVVAEHHPTPGVETLRIPMQGNPSYEVLRDTGQAIAITDINTHPVTAGVSELLTSYGIKSTLLIPLIVQGNLIGSIGLDATQAQRAFTQAEINFCRTLADRVALTVQNRQLLAQTQNVLQETTVLFRASRALNQSQSLQDVLQAITNNLPLERIDQCWIALTESTDQDPAYRSIEIKAMWDHEGDTSLLHTHLTAQELPLIAGPDAEQTWVVNDLDSETQFDARSTETLKALGIKSALSIPLIVGDTLLGWFMLITHHRTHIFAPDQVRPYQALADQAAVAIRNQQLLQQVQSSLKEVETVHRQYLRSEWATFLQSQERPTAIAYDQGTLLPAQDLWSPLVEQAVNQGNLVTHSDLSDQAQGVSMVAPLKVRGQILGVIGLQDPEQDREWTPEELNMVQEIAERVAQAVESARLLTATQTSLAEQEQLAIQLEAVSKISRAATSILELDILLPSMVELIRDHFNYYHAQVFLVDSTRDWAVLQASTGKVGQRLLKRGHALEVGGSSVIGYVTSSGEPKIAHDVDQDATHFKNELLPDTRSEMAIPLRAGERIIGALDVQSKQPDDFSSKDVQVLSTLADQLAVAIDNARLYEDQLETAQKLREVDRLKNQFLANMSHELRTPLNSIIGFSRVILKGIDGPLTDLQKQDLTAIYNSGQNLLKLINAILDHAKIAAGKMELTLEETDLAEVIQGAMTTAQALVKDKPEIELRHTIAPNMPLIIADATRIRQVLLNLLSNSSKFTDKGYIELSTTYDARFVTVQVSDSGVGVPPEKFDVIFQAFEQVDGSTTRSVGGTGLGLPISRQFIELHGGRIWVESQIGVGSTFTVQLPIKGPQAADIDEQELAQTTSQRLILAIDDDVDVINMYKRHLEKQNYFVLGLSESEQAMQKARELNPYAILLDLLMPKKDGWEIIHDLKADPQTQDIPIIMCSIISAAGRGFSMGAADFLVKPISESQLLSALARLRLSDELVSDTGESHQVLIIDDTPEDRKLLRRTLESTGELYQVIEASDGLQGIEIIQQQLPDLIVLDLMMPEMDGFAVLELLKSDEELRRIPIIIVTAKDLTEQERTRINGQVAALFQKGLFREEELLQDVNYALLQLDKLLREKTEE